MLVLLNGLQAGNRSGTGRYIAELARWLPDLAPDLDFAVIWPEGMPHPHRRHDAFLPRNASGRFRRIFFDQIVLPAERKRLRANVVHYPANIGNFGELHNQVITVHDLSFFREPRWFGAVQGRYYRYAVRRSVAHAQRVIVDSAVTKVDLCERCPVSEDRVDVVPLGVDERFRPASEEAQAGVRAKYALPEPFFLYVGAIEPRKNIPGLIAAWSAIAPACPHDLVIAGRKAWKTHPILKAGVRSPFAERIHWPGFVDEADLPALMSAATAFVWPSFWEGFGLPPLEAMACGTPVLTANTSGLPETVGDAALLIDPADTEAIADGILRLANDAGLRGALEAAGRQQAARFTWQRTAQRTIDTYYKVLNL